MLEVNDNNFQKEVIEKSAEKPVLVDFYAEWCGPCHALTPRLELLEEEYGDRVVFAKLNIDESPAKASEYNIRSVPTVKLFKNGNVADEFIGLMHEDEIREWLDRNLQNV
ncbi:thioredoxin [Candidatus Woesearchaeota archaeon]|nr:MAG: thioredoxin [Candidatus Woesearchaeota archaeon]